MSLSMMSVLELHFQQAKCSAVFLSLFFTADAWGFAVIMARTVASTELVLLGVMKWNVAE